MQGVNRFYRVVFCGLLASGCKPSAALCQEAVEHSLELTFAPAPDDIGLVLKMKEGLLKKAKSNLAGSELVAKCIENGSRSKVNCILAAKTTEELTECSGGEDLGTVQTKVQPQVTATAEDESPPAPAATAPPKVNCVTLGDLRSKVVSKGGAYWQLAWKTDVTNSCDQSVQARATFTVYDGDDFKLDSDTERVTLAPSAVTKIRGKMMLEANHGKQMARTDVSLVGR